MSHASLKKGCDNYFNRCNLSIGNRMKFLLLLSILMNLAITSPEPLPSNLPKGVLDKAKKAEINLLALSDCEMLLQLYDPKKSDFTQLGLCVYPMKIEQGIFVSYVCVGALVEAETATRHPFYGSKGHWGIEGKCETDRLKKKFLDTSIDTTVNPITDLRQKQKEGKKVRLLRDRLGLWTTLKERITPR